MFQNLSDADGASLLFVFICKLSCSNNEKTARNIIFEVLTKCKVLNRLDLSNDFWKQFFVQNKSLKKQVGLYEVENINKAKILTIAINQKKIFFSIIRKIFQSIKNIRVGKRILQGWILTHIQKDFLHYMNIVWKLNKKQTKQKTLPSILEKDLNVLAKIT